MEKTTNFIRPMSTKLRRRILFGHFSEKYHENKRMFNPGGVVPVSYTNSQQCDVHIFRFF